MKGDDHDDILQWLRENAASRPFERLRKFRCEHPGEPVPDDLEFAALYAPIIEKCDGRLSFDKELAAQIDAMLKEEDRSRGGGQYGAGRIEAFKRIDALLEGPNLTLSAAIDKVLDELQCQNIDENPEALTRAYQRHTAKMLPLQIGEAISAGDEETAIELLRKLKRRHNIFGRRWND